jgi:hypothetical protein
MCGNLQILPADHAWERVLLRPWSLPFGISVSSFELPAERRGPIANKGNQSLER